MWVECVGPLPCSNKVFTRHSSESLLSTFHFDLLSITDLNNSLSELLELKGMAIQT